MRATKDPAQIAGQQTMHNGLDIGLAVEWNDGTESASERSVVLLLLALWGSEASAQQAAKARPSPRAPSPFADTDAKLQQGRFEEAKSRLEKELSRDWRG